jgi:PAS domain S-box-containing protein
MKTDTPLPPALDAVPGQEPVDRGIRDLVALSTLPALWIGAAPDRIAQSLADAVFGILRPAFVFVRTEDVLSPMIRASGPSLSPALLASFSSAVTRLALSQSWELQEVPHPDRDETLRVFLLPLGMETRHGVLAVASARADFPTPLERTLVCVAANQGALALASARDAANRRAAEEALRKSEERYRLAARATQDVLWDWDMGTGAVVWNEALLAVFGYDPAEAGGPIAHAKAWWTERIHSEDRARVEESFGAAATSASETWCQEYRFRRRDGSYAVVLDRGYIGRGPDGTAVRFIGSMADISAQKAAEERIRQLNARLEQIVQDRTKELVAANKELESFCYSVSHDLRSPLRSIAGFSQAVLDDCVGSLGPDGQAHFRRIQAAVLRMSALIDGLLALSRLTRKEMERSPVDLSALAGAVVEELGRSDPGRRVDVDIEPGLAAVGDRQLIRAMLQNLLENAWKFTARRPEARIAFGRDAGDRRRPFFVRDNGAGFDMTFRDKLFNPFQRLHGDDEYPGNGIGLATVLRIVHRHGGRVWAEGRPGHGATFYFTLPGPVAPGAA